MGVPITNITIVGGGTSGWITAAYLNHWLQWGFAKRAGMRITVIESLGVPTIGVGESTVPTMRYTLRMLQISESEFLARTNATFKTGIRFDRWNVDGAGRPLSFVHPFTGGMSVRGRNPGASFQMYGIPGAPETGPQDYVRAISHVREVIEARKGPRLLNGAPFTGPLHYAYHLDAGKFAEFLAELSISRGAQHIRDDVTGVELDDRGYITSLKLKERGTLPVQLVIDCTGFRGLLINEALREPFVSYSDYLLNDRAIPIQVAHGPRKDLLPATVATAMDAGWSWRIPLYSRVGTGYVYSSAFKSDQQARHEFDAHLAGEQHLTDSRVLSMRVGRCRHSWVRNCVAIGLSSGFLEPLESTAIQFIEVSVRQLLQLLPTTDYEESLRSKYNVLTERYYDEVRDFLGVHFSLSNREDTPYWRAVRHEAKKSDSLRASLEIWEHALPDPYDPRPSRVFGHWSVASLLFGKGIYGQPLAAGTEVLPEQIWQRYWQEWSAVKQATLSALPDHLELLESMRAQAKPGESALAAPRGREFAMGGDVLTDGIQVMSPSIQPRLRPAYLGL